MNILNLKRLFFLLLFAVTTQFALGQDISDKIDSFARTDNAAALAKLITKENVNDCYENYSALSIAIRNNATKCIDLLIDKGANVGQVCNNKSPIFFAVKYGDLKMVEKLVAKGAKLNESFENKSLIEYAKRYGKEDIIRYLESKQ